MNYEHKISESVDYLLQLSRRQTLTRPRDRLQFLLLLKQGHTQAQAGQAIGLQLRQSHCLWSLYRRGGLAALLNPFSKAYFGKLSSQQLSRLRVFLRQDQAQSLRAVQEWLLAQERVHYSLGGLSLLFKRLKVKLKTGRPSNPRQDTVGLQAFKKTLLP